MKIIDCIQGTEAWRQARLGVPTASQFGRILTPATRKLSKQASGYIEELLAEWAIGEPCDGFGNDFTERGTELEPEAVAAYELQAGLVTEEVGFVTTDDGAFGCSPDRLVGADGGLEIKCPAAKTHIRYHLAFPDVPAQYIPQIQGSMWVTGRAWWDFFSYNPIIPPVLIRVERDAEYMAAFDEALGAFRDDLESARTALTDRNILGRI